MAAKVISNAKVTVLAAVLAAAGALLCTGDGNIFAALALGVAAMATLLSLANLRQWRPSLILLLLVAALPVVYFLYAQARQHKPEASDLSHYAGREVIFTGTCKKAIEPAGCARGSRASLQNSDTEVIVNVEQLLFPERRMLSGKTLLRLREPLFTQFHDATLHLQIRAYVQLPHKNTQPWQYDKSKHLAESGIYSICYPGAASRYAVPCLEVLPAQAPSADSREIETLCYRYEQSMAAARSLIVNSHRQYLPFRLADLLSSMVLGNRAVVLPEDITCKFRDVGLSHVLAASGFNLTIVTAMSFWFCRLLTPSMLIANCVCFSAMLGFVCLAGPSPSVLRAALMCTFMLASRCSQRTLSISAALAAAFMVTVSIDPLCTSDLGLQLSYSATVGIVCGAHALSRFLYPGSSRLWRSLADCFSVVSIAQASVMPIQLYCFWKTGTLFLPANLLVSPLITPVTVLGFASSLLALLPAGQDMAGTIGALISFIDALAFIPLAMMSAMVDFLSAFEAAKISLGQPSLLAIFIYYGGLLLLFVALRIEKHRTIALSALAIGTTALLFRLSAPALTVASVHNQIILIDDRHKALMLSKENEKDKMIERFLAFNAARFDACDFNVIAVSPVCTLIEVQKQFQVAIVRLDLDKSVLLSNLYNRDRLEQKILIIATVRDQKMDLLPQLVLRWQPDRIIIFGCPIDPPPGYLPCLADGCRLDAKDLQVKIVGSGGLNAIMLCREHQGSRQ